MTDRMQLLEKAYADAKKDFDTYALATMRNPATHGDSARYSELLQRMLDTYQNMVAYAARTK